VLGFIKYEKFNSFVLFELCDSHQNKASALTQTWAVFFQLIFPQPTSVNVFNTIFLYVLVF
jgi:hypothetical protein